ncbi:hypothetical protein N802_17595 [Knoellia sinensis KCTC 19936]|uniref:Uncharacterized protein n=1 Tax=Knoellia sinensis KCTC 19936 TaxID=1385520 RepID=A0A0A0J5S1_9MICO|nr:hypothetical protein [Knoellia sinensis]KGN32700.1 hypothetical protein N802_17595 [Knoellia sinensis KCTC 19936]
MPELPASVRIALWVTSAWADAGSATSGLEAAIESALPDVDAVGAGVRTLDLWHDLGEKTVWVALPSSGDPSSLPRCGGDALAAAVEAEECLVAPGLGALLVPSWSTFGAPGATGADAGTRLDWTAYDCDPVPIHKVEALDPRETTRSLTTTVLEMTTQLDELGGQPFDAASARGALPRAGQWALPDALPGQALRAITFAAAISNAAAAGLDGPHDGPDGWTQQRRVDLLRELRRVAERALADATNAGVTAVAHRRTSR